MCQNVPPLAPHVPAVKTGIGGFRPQVWHHYQDISLLLNFYLKLKFEVRFFLGPLVYLFHQNVLLEAPHVPAVKTFLVVLDPKCDTIIKISPSY